MATTAPTKAEQESEGSNQSPADMTVQNLLVQMQTRFQAMSESIMGTKIDELEQSINDLKAEMGMECPPAKPTPEEANPANDSA
ncbi:hypothetical protein ACMD2_00878 [Ananas comosus]|uniref:Heat shock factor-binding protein 1-like n=1 Tax=Ananas comosus TaxID=4615 RepID=A0A199UMI9_ANACO|nr:hypothetical protein ACMD2_00878 [Ananas comosus]